MKRYLLTILLLGLLTHTAQASRYMGGRAWGNYEHNSKVFLGYSPDWRALHIICEGGTTTKEQCYALILQPTKNFDNGTALATALAWAADPAFVADPKGYAKRKIEEEDPVAIAAKAAEAARVAAEAEAAAAEAARIAEQERLAAEQQERERQAAEAAAEAARVAAEAEAARILEQEREAAAAEAARLAAEAEAEAASAITADGSSQDGESDHESSRGGRGSPLTTLSIRSPEDARPSRHGLFAPEETPDSVGAATPTPAKAPSSYALAALASREQWKRRVSMATQGSSPGSASAAEAEMHKGSAIPSKDHTPVASGSMRTAQVYSGLVSSGMSPAEAMGLAPQVAARSAAPMKDNMAAKDVPSKTPRTPGMPPLPRPFDARKADVSLEAALTAQIFASLIASGTPVQSAMESAILAAQAALGGPTPMSAAGAGVSSADFVPGRFPVLAGRSALPAAGSATSEDPTDIFKSPGPSGRISPPLDASDRPGQ